MSTLRDLADLINDPYEGPEEGVDFWVDERGYIQVDNTYTAGIILRRANTSGQFNQTLVRLGQRGDSMLLGFDTLVDADAIYSTKIGLNCDILAEIKEDLGGKFCVYLDHKRSARMFNKLAGAKKFVKSLDKDLKTVSEPVSTYDDLDD